MNKNESNNSLEVFNFVIKNWGKLLTLITVTSGAGFGVGVYFTNLDWKMLNFQMKSDYESRIQEAKRDCDVYKLEKYGQAVSELEKVIKELNEKENGKKK